MHIILGVLGSVVTILWILHSLAEMGIDLGGMNPWLWRRRRGWRNRYEANPIYSIENPMDVTALLITAVAKADGEISSSEKKEVLSIFMEEFGLSKRDAAGLLISSSHVLGKGEEVKNDLQNILRPSLQKFTPDQVSSAMELLRRISNVDDAASELQSELIAAADNILGKRSEQGGKWSEAV
jgi:uncharacterized tellurite resistance protein B-like protein